MFSSLDLSVVRVRLEKDKPDWSATKIDQAISEYLKFLELSSLYPGEPIVPTSIADEVWHRHLLFTRKYSEDCEKFLGHFLHHEPWDGSDVDDEAHDKSKALYTKHFHDWPDNAVYAALCMAHCNATMPPPKKGTKTAGGIRG